MYPQQKFQRNSEFKKVLKCCIQLSKCLHGNIYYITYYIKNCYPYKPCILLSVLINISTN